MVGTDAVRREIDRKKQAEVGKDFDWSIDSEGILSVTGTGRMPDLGGRNHARSLWEDIKETIRQVDIGEGITEIGLKNFEECRNLTEVHLPSTLTRIRAYAFRGCTALMKVEAGGKEFRYIYDKPVKEDAENTRKLKRDSEEDREPEVVFGDRAFEGTPWAVQFFGEFYCRDGILYICFSGQDKIRVPEGVHTIAKLSFRNVRAKELILPESVTRIEDYAFGGARFDKVLMPDGMNYLLTGDYYGSILEAAGCSEPAERRPRFLKVPFLYELALQKTKYKGYRKFFIREKKKTDGEGAWGRKLIDVSAALRRRLKKGGVLIGIRWDEEHRVQSVKSFVWLEDDGTYKDPVIDEYLMYPVRLENGSIEPYRDSTTYQETDQLEYGFGDMNAEELMKMGAIRYPQPGTEEEWFWSEDKRNFEGPVEIELLELWMEDHPGYVIDTMEENAEKDKYRLFVDF